MHNTISENIQHPSSLPIPSAKALEHSQQLISHILTQIQTKGGMLSFAEYMDLALYTPGLGYYHVGTQKFGMQGDFVTAPEISPLFSFCLAKQCKDIVQHFPAHTAYSILEIGAGSGQMAVDLLFQLSQDNCLPEHYYILELSPDLKYRQQQKINTHHPDYFNRVKWLDALPNTPFLGIILANEVLDAMPVNVFKMIGGEMHEQMVMAADSQNPEISFDYHYTLTTQKNALALKTHFTENYVSETNLNINPWLQSLSVCLSQGVILLIDYGFPRHHYYHPDRTMGTLMCHYRHRAHSDPFLYPGLQDITAHVDFTAVAQAASLAELDVLGYTHQAAFLLSCGLLEFYKQSIPNKHQAINTLTSPAEMGELFKVMALGKDFDQTLLGFQMSNRVFSLYNF